MKHSTAMVNELTAAKRLILKHFELVVDFLMHISGLITRTKPYLNLDAINLPLQLGESSNFRHLKSGGYVGKIFLHPGRQSREAEEFCADTALKKLI